MKNFDELASILLEFYKSKESLDSQNKNGDFALLYAVVHKNHKMVKKILETGASADLTNVYGLSPLWYAVYNNDKNTFFELIKFVKNFEPKSRGVNYNSFRQDPEMIYASPLTPLQVAEDKDFHEMIYYLCCLGVKLDTQTLSALKFKLSNFDDELNIILAENEQVKLKIFENLKLLINEINKPISLKRLCRNELIKIYNLDTLKEIADGDVLPKSLKDFILLYQV